MKSRARGRDPAIVLANRSALVVDIEMQLRGQLAAKLMAEARARGRDPGTLLSDVVEMVIEDDLFEAVLDDE